MNKKKDLEHFFDRNVSYSKDKFEIYNRLENDILSPFKGKTMADIFVHAVVFGFKDGKKTKLVQATPNISTAAFTNRQKAILLSLAISHAGELDVLFDEPRVVKILEEYANAGIGRLESEMIDAASDADVVTKVSSWMKETIDEELARHAP